MPRAVSQKEAHHSMFDRLDEWRARLQGRSATTARPGAEDDPAPDDRAPRRAMDDYGPCPSCGGPREVVMRPVGRDAARMGLVCTSCGTATEI